MQANHFMSYFTFLFFVLILRARRRTLILLQPGQIQFIFSPQEQHFMFNGVRAPPSPDP